MKIAIALLVILCMLSSANAYTVFRYHNGDEILRQLQLKDDQIYILFFFDAPGANRDLRTTNDYYKDRLRAEVLEPVSGPKNQPADYFYAEIDATDVYGNGYLVDRLGVDRAALKEKPTIVVMKNGVGNLVYGPTAMHSIISSLKTLSNPAK